MGGIFSTPQKTNITEKQIKTSSTPSTHNVPQMNLPENSNTSLNQKSIDDPEPGDPCGLYIQGINKRWDRERLEKWLRYLKINFLSVNKKKNQNYGAVRFDSNEERRRAYQILINEEPQDEQLIIIPLRKSLSMTTQVCHRMNARLSNQNNQKNINELITPLFKVEYSEQISIKKQKLLSSLNQLIPLSSEVFIFPSPNQTHYENKTDLLFGFNFNGETEVGFHIGSRNDDIIVPVDDCIGIPICVPTIANHLKEFSIRSNLPVFDRALEKGFWKFAHVRTNSENDVLLVIGIYGKADQNIIEKVKTEFSESVNSLYLAQTFCKDGYGSNPIIIHLSGNNYLSDSIGNLSIELDIFSKFPINKSSSEVLLQQLNNIIKFEHNNVIIDLYCGSGILGLSLLNNCSFNNKLIGIDCDEQSILESLKNAKYNNILNTEFVLGRAEQILPTVLYDKKYEKNSFVVILDPPNRGIKKQILWDLRNCKSVSKLIFVGNKPESFAFDAKQILLDEETETPKFTVKNVFGVDLYPNRDKIEHVIQMIR